MDVKGTVVRVSVHVQPRASRSEIIGQHGAALKVRLQAPPVDGAANEALVHLLGGHGSPFSVIQALCSATFPEPVALTRAGTTGAAAPRSISSSSLASSAAPRTPAVGP